MIIVIAVLLALIPAIAILYPFLRGRTGNEYLDDESSPQAELQRRWDAVVAGLKSAELEHSIGNLADEDYRWLRQRYMIDAARVLKAMELEQEQEAELRASIERELAAVRVRAVGGDDAPQTSGEATHAAGRNGEEAEG